jgi:type IV secretory pathway VirB2 component (pilin)
MKTTTTLVASLRDHGAAAYATLTRLSILLSLTLLNSAYAQPVNLADESTPIFRMACGVYNVLSSPAAFLVGLIVLVVGGIAIAVGGKRVIGGVVWGIIGVGLAISAGQIARALFVGATAVCGV